MLATLKQQQCPILFLLRRLMSVEQTVARGLCSRYHRMMTFHTLLHKHTASTSTTSVCQQNHQQPMLLKSFSQHSPDLMYLLVKYAENRNSRQTNMTLKNSKVNYTMKYMILFQESKHACLFRTNQLNFLSNILLRPIFKYPGLHHFYLILNYLLHKMFFPGRLVEFFFQFFNELFIFQQCLEKRFLLKSSLNPKLPSTIIYYIKLTIKRFHFLKLTEKRMRYTPSHCLVMVINAILTN